MRKFLFVICSLFLITTSNAQQQVWQYSDYNPTGINVGLRIKEIVSTNNKIFYSDNHKLFCTTGNENSAVLLLSNLFEISHLTVFGDKVVFFVIDDSNLPTISSSIWITNGTKEGTYELTQSYYGTNFAVFKDKIYFTSFTSIYSSDGTPDGTKKIVSLPPTDEQFPSPIVGLVALEDKLIYSYRGQLGVTDGVSAEIKFLSESISSTLIDNVSYPLITVFNNKVFFAHKTSDLGLELWSTDGTDEHTVLFKDLNPGAGDAFKGRIINNNPNLTDIPTPWFTSSNGKLYFVAYNGTRTNVWVIDGTSFEINELYNYGGGYSAVPVNLKSIDGNIYFSNKDGAGLFFSDGSNNTVQHIEGTKNPTNAYKFTKYKDSIYFIASDPDHGYELWRTAGTAESTTLVADICKGTCFGIDYNATGFITCGDIFFFSAGTTSDDSQLWKIGGTATPTTPETPTAVVTTDMQKIKYYPNPCQDYISVELLKPASNIRIISATGTVLPASWTNENNTVRIQTKDLNAGIYRILIDSNEPLSIIKE